MTERAWTRPVGEGTTAEVRLESVADSGGVRYRIAFPFLVADESADDLHVTGAGRIVDHKLRSHDGLPVSDVVVSIPGGAYLERLVVRSRDGRIVVHLPSEALLQQCDDAADGDAAAAEGLLDAFDTAVQLPLVCGSFLGPGATVDVVGTVARSDRHAASQLHSYRYAIVRAALVSGNGLNVRTYPELRTLVEGLDALDAIGELSVVEAIGDVMATVHPEPEATDALLERLGADYEQLDDASDGLLTACFLAQTALTDGVEAAQRFEVPRKLPPRGHFDRRKRAVFAAEYGQRGRAWRRLLNAARRESADEIGYVLAYALYWTGEEARTDSRAQELVLRAAERVAEHKRLEKISSRARFGRLLAAGHRLRGAHCWDPSARNFEAARALAADHAFLPSWEPILAGALVRSRGLSNAGENGAAVELLDRAIEELLSSDPPTAVANRCVRHLKAQKSEIDSLRFRSEAPALAGYLLSEARDHYAALGYGRSRAKVERQLAALAGEAGLEAEAAAEPVATPSGTTRATEEPTPIAAGESEAAAEPWAMDAGDWLEHVEYPDEDAPREAADDRFDDPYAF